MMEFPEPSDNSDELPADGDYAAKLEAQFLSYESVAGSFPFEEIYKSNDRISDPLPALVTFPKDNTKKITFTKFHKSQYGFTVAEKYLDVLDPYVKVCFECFSADWTLINSGYASYDRWKPSSSVLDFEIPQYEAIDLELCDSDNSDEKDLLHVSNHLNAYNRHTDSNNRKKRRKNRLELFQYYDPHYDWQPGCEVSLCKRIRKNYRPEIRKQENVKFKPFHFVVIPQSLVFQVGDLEPFFCHLTLYQMDPVSKEVSQISERFHFQTNTPGLLEKMKNHWHIPDDGIRKTKNEALFSVTRRSAHVYLVLEISKILQGSPEIAIEPYAKLQSSLKPKEQEKIVHKIRNESADYCSRLGKYRQPFGWAILRVFDPKGDIMIPPNALFEQIWARNPRDSISSLIQMFAFDSPQSKKLKNLHGACNIEVRKIEPEQLEAMRLVDASLQISCTSEDTPDDVPLLKEIPEFLQNPRLVPNFFYINNMYVYLLSANLSNRSGRNIVVRMQIKEFDDPNAPGLPCICHPYSNVLVDEISSNVHYHNRNPLFSEEFKLLLPPKLTERHHLLFTFSHVIVAKKKRSEDSENVITYAVVPLFSGGRIVAHNHGNRYCTSFTNKLEPGYISSVQNEDFHGATRPPLALRFHLVSTIFPEDKSITEFLNIYHTSEQEVPDHELIPVLRNLCHLTELLAIQYLPVIINNLLEVMVTRKNNKPQYEAFCALVIVMHKVSTKIHDKDVPRNALLELYSSDIFQQTFTTKHSVYESLCSNFLLYLMDKKCQTREELAEDSVFLNSWFIFDLVIKSMALKLHAEGKLNQSNRQGIFNDVFVRTLSRLLVNLAKYFKEHMSNDLEVEVRMLNNNLALFMSDLFAVFDRGIVLDMIRDYLQEMNHPKEELASTILKVEFLRIITDHEHYIPLNLPFENLNILSNTGGLTVHPLANTLICNVIQILCSSLPAVWPRGVSVLYDILVKNAFDSRYQSSQARERVAGIYFVIIPMVLENWSLFAKWRSDATIECKREFYVCILFVLKACSRELLHRWWQGEVVTNQNIFLELLDDITICFEYDPKLTRQTNSKLTPEVALFINKAGTDELADFLRCISQTEADPAEEDKRLRHLTLECHTIILDVLEEFISNFKRKLRQKTCIHPTMSRIVQLLCTMMKVRSSFRFTRFLYATLRAFAYKFIDVLFKGDNNYLYLILERIMVHCNTPEQEIHTEASSLLFLLVKLNQRTVGDFGRTKIQSITTLSNLVQSKRIDKDVVLNGSFARLSMLALNDFSTLDYRDIAISDALMYDDKIAHATYSSFARSVQEMSETLSNILRDTLRVIETAETADARMKANLYYQIAESYKHTPDLRLTWLEKLAILQQQSENFVEAGISFVHACALIADYLLSSGKLDHSLINTNIFLRISPQLREFVNAEDGACHAPDFCEKGFIKYVRFAIRCFKTAEYYEFAVKLFNVITPIYEENESYHDLSQAHTQLQDFWINVNTNNEGRLFGKFFRVGFFGTPFGKELNGHEFVYKEPKLTHILELTDSLKKMYSNQFQQEIQHIDGGRDVSQIDPDKCFLQITKIEPHISDNRKKTFFSLNVNLSEFVFETPFTHSGKSHAADASEQYKRKTILTVSGAFPSMLTRLPVIRKREVIVSPIESAIEDLDKRNVHLLTEIERKPVNHKTLTQVLQGSALPQVNEGALLICKVFLANHKQHPKELIKSLCDTLHQFLDNVREGLNQNKQLIKTEHDKEFHFEMESGFTQLATQIEKYITRINGDSGDFSSEGETTESQVSSRNTTTNNLPAPEELPVNVHFRNTDNPSAHKLTPRKRSQTMSMSNSVTSRFASLRGRRGQDCIEFSPDMPSIDDITIGLTRELSHRMPKRVKKRGGTMDTLLLVD